MGVVYLAERVDGAVPPRRSRSSCCAPARTPRSCSARFLAERQILASLSHPNIAQLLDGGTTDDGLPVPRHGVRRRPADHDVLRPRTRSASRRGCGCSSTSARAVQYAHQNLVIHRDLKPGNILVTRDGRVEAARLRDREAARPRRSADGAPRTRTALRVMTPDYASPEQVRGESLTTASDVYALGVVLYELLAGRAHRIRSAPAPRASCTSSCANASPSGRARGEARAVRRRPGAPTPAAMRRRATRRRSDCSAALAGDLDAIVMMALRKEPRRRYGSAELLAEDVGATSAGCRCSRDIRAAPTTFGKFLRRHRTAASLGAIAVLSLDRGHRRRREADGRGATRARPRDGRADAGAAGAARIGRDDELSRRPVRRERAGAGSARTWHDRRADRARHGADRTARRIDPLVQARMLEGIGPHLPERGTIRRRETGLRALARAAPRQRCRGDSAEAATTLLQLANMLRITGRYAGRRLGRVGGASHLREVEWPGGSVDVADAWQMLSMLAVYRSDLAAGRPTPDVPWTFGIAAYGADDPRHRLCGRDVRRRAASARQVRRRRTLHAPGHHALRTRQGAERRQPGRAVDPAGRAVATSHEDYDEAARLMERGSRSRKRRSARATRERRIHSSFSGIGVASRQFREGRAIVAPRGRRSSIERSADTTSRWPTPSPISRRSTRAPAGGPTPKRRSARRFQSQLAFGTTQAYTVTAGAVCEDSYSRRPARRSRKGMP